MKKKSHSSLKSEVNLRQLRNFFDSFFNEDENNLKGWSPVQTYPAGTQIFQQESPATVVYFVEQGLIKLTRLGSRGHQVIVGLRYRHWLLGAPSVLLERPYASTATTLTQCDLRSIPAKDFLQLLKTDTLFSYQIQRMLSEEIYSQVTKVATLGMSCNDRLKQFLCELILEQKHGVLQDPIQLQLQVKHKELAQIIATTPEHLCRILKKMEQQGIIKRDKEILLITDPQSLLRSAET